MRLKEILGAANFGSALGYFFKRDYSRSLKEFEEVLSHGLSGIEGWVYLYMGRNCLALERLEEAGNHMSKALQLLASSRLESAFDVQEFLRYADEYHDLLERTGQTEKITDLDRAVEMVMINSGVQRRGNP